MHTELPELLIVVADHDDDNDHDDDDDDDGRVSVLVCHTVLGQVYT